MNDFEKLYDDLRKHIALLEKTFIQPFIPADPSTTPDKLELCKDIKEKAISKFT